MQGADMPNDAVHFPDTPEAESYRRRCHVVGDAQRLEDAETEECSQQQVADVVHELVASPSACSGKSEMLLLLKALAKPIPEIRHYQHCYQYQHPS